MVAPSITRWSPAHEMAITRVGTTVQPSGPPNLSRVVW